MKAKVFGNAWFRRLLLGVLFVALTALVWAFWLAPGQNAALLTRIRRVLAKAQAERAEAKSVEQTLIEEGFQKRPELATRHDLVFTKQAYASWNLSEGPQSTTIIVVLQRSSEGWIRAASAEEKVTVL